MSFLALSLSRKISYAKNFVLLPPEIPGGRYNLLLIAVNQIFYHRFIGLLHKKFFLTKTVQERTWNPELKTVCFRIFNYLTAESSLREIYPLLHFMPFLI